MIFYDDDQTTLQASHHHSPTFHHNHPRHKTTNNHTTTTITPPPTNISPHYYPHHHQDNIPASIMKQIRSKYSNNPDFDPEKIKVVSGACEGLCRWILAIVKYDALVPSVVIPSAVVLWRDFF